MSCRKGLLKCLSPHTGTPHVPAKYRQLQQYRVINLEFRQEDFKPIVEMVKAADPFVISPSTVNDPYDLREYIAASSGGPCRLWSLLDNNILTGACALARGESVIRNGKVDESKRLVAAIMCFLILGGFELEPFLAVYEQAATTGQEAGVKALKAFRIADNIHPQQNSKGNGAPNVRDSRSRSRSGSNRIPDQVLA